MSPKSFEVVFSVQCSFRVGTTNKKSGGGSSMSRTNAKSNSVVNRAKKRRNECRGHLSTTTWRRFRKVLRKEYLGVMHGLHT